MAREFAKQPFHERIAEQLIEQLKEGRAPWQKPWGTDGIDFMPTNAVTGKRYKGVNAMVLMSEDRADQRWLTYKHAEAMGAQVRKGERGTGIIYWKFDDEQTVKDAQGKPVKNAAGETMKVKVELERPRPFYATVFNAEQVDGLPPAIVRQSQPFDQHARAEAIMANSGVKITEAPGDQAYYRRDTDTVRLPERSQFHSEALFYATALHELGHATGHPTRLDRDPGGPFGSEGYAKEELRAEIASLILGNDLGIGHDPSQHVAYVASWIKALTEQPLEIMRACADAEKIRDYVLAWENQQSVAIEALGEAAELDEIIAELTAHSAVANAGYDPLESWRTLQSAAANAGLVAAIRRGAPEDDDVLIPPYRITYATAEGVATTIKTDLYNDGKALTMVQGERVPGTGFTSDPEWQRAALATAAATKASIVQDRIAAIENDEYQRLSIAAARIENAQGIGASDGQCRFIAKAIANHDLSDIELFGTALAAEAGLSSDMAAVAIAAINRRPAPSLASEVAVSPAPTPDEPARTQRRAGRTYISSPYSDRREVKALGGEWDADRKSWFVPAGVDPAPFAKWQTVAPIDRVATPEPAAAATKPATERVYIAVPYAERDEAKSLGAKWDRVAKSWYAPEGASSELATRYSADRADRQAPATDPRVEFTDALKAIGCIVSGQHPIMDGQRHRIEAEGDKKGERSGFYIGYLDGLPAGYMVNNRTGKGGDWKSTGYMLTDEQRAQLSAEAATKLQERQAARDAATAAVAKRVAAELATARPAETPTPYMIAKGIEPKPGTYTDASGTKTLVPAYDVTGKHWTTQTIAEDGTKLFAKDSRKEGCFHVVGGQAALVDAPAIVIAEGYSTAATLSAALGYATVAAFDAGNLKAVAVALAAEHLGKPLIVAGDDDYRLTLKLPFENRGAVAAQAAAEAAGGTHILPVLTQADREKGLSDFNDLDTRAEGASPAAAIGQAKRQIEPHVNYQIARAADTSRSAAETINPEARQQEPEPRAVRIRG